MKTVSLFFCALIVLIGLITAIKTDFLAGTILLIIASLAFLIIAPKTDKVKGYNSKHWMNK